jgi:hypothetical protein
MTDYMTAHERLYSKETRAAAAVLSLLIPGLGQIYQGILRRDLGRLLKGFLFLVSLWGMFFYGMWLGHWRNVYLPHVQDQLKAEGRPIRWFGVEFPPLLGNLYTRLHYVGQFWVGMVAWPAMWNYYVPDYPIFGSYQASPGALRNGEGPADRERKLKETEQQHNDLQLAMGKQWDIAWVYTVIAGVLNILVIYDAWAGPVHPKRSLSAGLNPQ